MLKSFEACKKVYYWGNLIGQAEFSPLFLPFCNTKDVVGINGGFETLFLLTEEDKVYSMGSGEFGQLGSPTTINKTPTQIIGASHFFGSTGKQAIVSLLNKEDRSEEEEGQVVLLLEKFDQLSPVTRGRVLEYSCLPHNRSFFLKLVDNMKAPLYCSTPLAYSSFFYSNSSGFVSAGSNIHGQRGISPSSGSDSTEPQRISVVPTERIVSLSSGYNHTLLMLKDRRVYGIGNSQAGQLGTGSNSISDLLSLFFNFCVPTFFFIQQILSPNLSNLRDSTSKKSFTN